ncbi:MAG TPA: hypothetical protein VFT50_03480 [Baekduia sp.]|nr:hypothetical protein [Baekduia sp.]
MPVLLALSLSLGLLLPGASTAAASPITRHAASVVEEQIGGQRAVVATPRTPTDKVVVVAHGAGRDAVTMMADIPTIAGALLAHGYTVVTSDAHGNNWGSPAGRRDYAAVAQEMRRRGLDRVYVLARSMGGLATLAAMRQIHPLAWAGIYPACNLRSLSRFREGISRAYGVPWRRLERARRLSPIRPQGVAGMPMIFWASSHDTVVRKAANTDRCAAAARRAGAHVTVVTTRGDHGDPSNVDPPRLTAFFDAADAATAGTRR